jgi:hypothetical protein
VKVSDQSPVPWRIGDLVLVYLVNLAGLVLILIAWFEASDLLTIRAQIPWVNVGVTGIIVAGAGNVLWLLTGRRSVGDLRRRLTPRLPGSGRATSSGRAQPDTALGMFVAGTAMTRYHRADCPLVEGKPVTADSENGHRAAGRLACHVCVPARLTARR